MATHIREVKWETFTRRTEDPKLAYLERRLDEMHIAHRRNGRSFHAPILEVDSLRLDEAWDILMEPVAVSGGGSYTLDDIDDDDPMFLT